MVSFSFPLVILTILGLALFEVVSSIDNAIINAETLSTMSESSKKWFLSWGILLAVFVARGLLPWAIISLFRSVTVLYFLGGAFLVALFVSWLFGKEESIFTKGIEKLLGKNNKSDVSKIIYLELLDLVFSIDGVVGAFAFTLSVPLILVGNGIGAIVVRRLTVENIERIKKYRYLKSAAMCSIAVLGIIMLIESLGHSIPEYASPAATFVIIGFFFFRSKLST